ncbi:hypothetical protein [Streptomyces sp. NPDC088762]|uniref:hypothetical protein n=1 Tax=Streptomyces sp. NPDC088762 TaxID=3365891 RepID=UPI00380D7313
MKTKRSATLAGIALAVLVTTGAESSGCAPQADDNRPKVEGSVIGGRCTQRLTAYPYILAGQIKAYADSICREAVKEHSLTVIIQQRNTAGAWVEVGKASNHVSPALGVQKDVTVTIACKPGVYRAKMDATVETVKDRGAAPGHATITTEAKTYSAEDCQK